MKIYLAGRYGRRLELLGYAQDLYAAGHESTSRWLSGEHEGQEQRFRDIVAYHAWCAEDDRSDLMAAETVICFTEPEGQIAGRGRGGRHVEMGMALALNKRVVVVGHRENVFCSLPEVEFYPTWDSCLEALMAVPA